MSERSAKILEKPLAEWSEEEIKSLWLDLFFWVVENRSEWLKEAIELRKSGDR